MDKFLESAYNVKTAIDELSREAARDQGREEPTLEDRKAAKDLFRQAKFFGKDTYQQAIDLLSEASHLRTEVDEDFFDAVAGALLDIGEETTEEHNDVLQDILGDEELGRDERIRDLMKEVETIVALTMKRVNADPMIQKVTAEKKDWLARFLKNAAAFIILRQRIHFEFEIPRDKRHIH